MRKLKIINRLGVEIQLVELVAHKKIGGIITIAPDHEYKYPCNHNLDQKNIRLCLPHQHPINQSFIYLSSDFIDVNKITYVKKGDGDCWFVDPVHKATKLVRKHVYNSTFSPIALVECVLERIRDTIRV